MHVYTSLWVCWYVTYMWKSEVNLGGHMQRPEDSPSILAGLQGLSLAHPACVRSISLSEPSLWSQTGLLLSTQGLSLGLELALSATLSRQP